ncbi:tryptophan halogenase family protein [Brevundimonas sp. PAMC22021]|uniref:tryptophan halogenase family protein n=1 Tax=Brevundimonas sp. PAMC22021 TaxID=2861285 RepID=UPI001C62CCAC|nr:tryptophan halogenase family protein [Brevundimonas sp. PAMC22021]QYF88143.1 tryptophan 7-halogenase [Brevundimonas sp. PAMC22021]
MSDDHRRIRHVVVAGGGTAGWMAAAALANRFANAPLRITVVESSEIGTIGVGEATIPTIRRFYAGLGLGDAEVMKATEATCKLGIQFKGWSGEGSDFIHPFGRYGQDLKGIDFHHYWMRLREGGHAPALAEFSLGAALARGGRVTLPSRNPPSELSVFDWALHLDASLFAGLLRTYSEQRGVRRLDARIVSVDLRPEDGFIRALKLDGGGEIEGDLFVDCSGFRGLLIGQALGVPYQDWGEWLPCDAAFAVQSENADEAPRPVTQVTARSAGWQWGIPLRHRAGNGLVFSSAHMTDDEALAELRPRLLGRPLTEPRRIGFRPGRRQQAWRKNCVALGLAAGFLEPLESTSIALIETGIERLLQLFPDRDFDPASIDEFNDQTAREMERVRDFIILHYKLNGRDEPFWRDCREREIPDTLQRKLDLWKARGQFVRYRWEMFHPASWLAIYDGFGLYPDRRDPALDGVDPTSLGQALNGMRRAVAEAVADSPTHAEFLRALNRSLTA